LGSDWTILNRHGDSGNTEKQFYRPANVTINGSGYLQIDAKVQTYVDPAPDVDSLGTYNYTSGMIQWTPGITFTHGSLEVRAQMPAGTGPWPAIWLLGVGCQTTNLTTADNGGTCSWPNIGSLSDEIDFLEFLGSNRTSVNCQVHNDLGNDQLTPALGFDASAGLHTYRLVRASGSLTWFVDGAQIAQITSHVSDTPMALLINIAVGGTGGGAITDATLPQSMLIDYVRKVDAP
jgi:beta-glucanase (GH16 family)